MGEIKSGRGSVPDLAGSQHHLQASNEDREESAQSRGSVRGRGRGRARLLPTRNPHKGPLAQRGEAFRGGLRLWGPGSQLQLVQPQPICPSSSGLSLGQLTLRGEKRGGACPAQSSPRPPRAGEAPSWLSTRNQLLRAQPWAEGNHLRSSDLSQHGSGLSGS